MDITRRQVLIAGSGAVAAAFLGLKTNTVAAAPRRMDEIGPLLPDPEGVLDLPAGYRYRVISRTGSRMADGFLVPGMPDGMAAFAAPGGRLRLVRNHELDGDRARRTGSPFGERNVLLSDALRTSMLYDGGGELPSLGGTTTLVYNPASGAVEREHLSLVGTERNCAGGTTPWGSWLSCEESTARAGDVRGKDHGYVFEVPAALDTLAAPLPLKALGRFNHEAAVVDPRSGIVYLTEDRPEGLFYRFIPRTPARLADGGRLEALALADAKGADTRNWGARAGALPPGEKLLVRWLPLSDVDTPEDDLRQRGHAAGAAVFARGEGLWWGQGELYFTCTSGGAQQAGQVFRYRPARSSGGTLELFVESGDKALFANADNLTVTPWGDLLVCEDTDRSCALVGIRPDGSLYRLAHNPYNGSELAGVCFAPDGRTLFLNIQRTGLTLAITGPFPAL